MNRKHFLKSVLKPSAFLGIPFNSYSFSNDSIELINNTKLNINGSMFSFSVKEIKKVSELLLELETEVVFYYKCFNILWKMIMVKYAISDIWKRK